MAPRSQHGELYQRIYGVIRRVPRGRVATYGQISALAGIGHLPRQVGYALRHCRPEDDVPWQRIINAAGKISRTPDRQGGDDLQAELLRAENVEFDVSGRIDLERFRWEPDPEAAHGGPPRRSRRRPR